LFKTIPMTGLSVNLGTNLIINISSIFKPYKVCYCELFTPPCRNTNRQLQDTFKVITSIECPPNTQVARVALNAKIVSPYFSVGKVMIYLPGALCSVQNE
jgi:hypothetical protein